METLFAIILIIATLFVALVAGLLFAFVVVAMPGLGTLDDGAFIRAFQVIDGIIQNNQPLFMVVWMGSVLTLIAAVIVGFGQIDNLQWGLLIAATALYILGVQAPTVSINVPLNNEIQTVQTAQLDDSGLQQARAKFEDRWNRANQFRTTIAIAVTVLLLIVLLLL